MNSSQDADAGRPSETRSLSRVNSRLVSIRGLPMKRTLSRLSRQSLYGNVGGRRGSQDTSALVVSATTHAQQSMQHFTNQLQQYKSYAPIVKGGTAPSSLSTHNRPSKAGGEEKRLKSSDSLQTNMAMLFADQITTLKSMNQVARTPLLTALGTFTGDGVQYASLDPLSPKAEAIPTTVVRNQPFSAGKEIGEAENNQEKQYAAPQLSLFEDRATDGWDAVHADGDFHRRASQAFASAPRSGAAAGRQRVASLQLEASALGSRRVSGAGPAVTPYPEMVRAILCSGDTQLAEVQYDTVRQLESTEAAQQEVAWHTVQRGESGAPISRRRSRRIVYDFENNEALQKWLSGAWRTAAGAHEDAALVLQKAFRSYVARRTVARKRYERQLALLQVLSCEKEARREWEMASRLLIAEHHSTSGEADKRIRTMQFVVQKITAVALKKRARKLVQLREQMETQRYAATAIQRVWRGYALRARLLLEKEACGNPRMLAALTVQRFWRAHVQKKRRLAEQHAAAILQRAFRQWMARRRANALRDALHERERLECQRHAVQVLERLYRRSHPVGAETPPCSRPASSHAHAVKVMTDFLSSVARRQSSKNELLAKRKEDHKQRHIAQLEDAAEVIQRAWRLFKRTTALGSTAAKLNEVRCASAVSTICLHRKFLLERRAAQRACEARRERDYLVSAETVKEDAAVTIQKCWRAYSNRKLFLT